MHEENLTLLTLFAHTEVFIYIFVEIMLSMPPFPVRLAVLIEVVGF